MSQFIVTKLWSSKAWKSKISKLFGYKKVQELLPGILDQLSPEGLNDLKKIAESYAAANAKATGTTVEEASDDDEVPDLVEISILE